MADIDTQVLHSLFKLLNRSLLQYVSECDVWSDPDQADSQHVTTMIHSCVARQKKHIQQLAEPLVEGGFRVELGGYPTAFTDLHYVSLSYLLKQLVQEQSLIVDQLELAATKYPGMVCLKAIAQEEREIGRDLRELTQPKVTIVNS